MITTESTLGNQEWILNAAPRGHATRPAPEQEQVSGTRDAVPVRIEQVTPLSYRESLEQLRAILPRTAEALESSVNERGLEEAEAGRMAVFMRIYARHANFGNRDRFDRDAARIIGRRFSEIDYTDHQPVSSGSVTLEAYQERMRRTYAARGVPDFRTMQSLRNYFRHASSQRWFTRAYAPENTGLPGTQ